MDSYLRARLNELSSDFISNTLAGGWALLVVSCTAMTSAYEVGSFFTDLLLLVSVEILISDCSVPGVTVNGCWNKYMPVPWKESFDVVEL